MIHTLVDDYNPKKRVRSVKYAFKGITHALLNEAHFRIQILFTFLVIVLGFAYAISYEQWAILSLSLGLLLAAEMVNTVVENFMDFLIPEQSEVVRIIKDLSAGFVLIIGVATLLVVLLIFVPAIGLAL